MHKPRRILAALTVAAFAALIPTAAHAHPTPQPTISAGWHSWRSPTFVPGLNKTKAQGATASEVGWPQQYLGEGQVEPPCGWTVQQDYYVGTPAQIDAIVSDGVLASPDEDAAVVTDWRFVSGPACEPTPTATPTVTPTPEPTETTTPTPEPTPSQHTPEPTDEPTPEPSSSPTPSDNPTSPHGEPTDYPSCTPTECVGEPTPEPSSSPTAVIVPPPTSSPTPSESTPVTPVDNPDEPDLAETGSNAQAGALIAGLATLAGAALILARRAARR